MNGSIMYLPRGCLTVNTTVYGTISALVRSKSSPPRTNDLTWPPAVIDRQKKRYPDGLARLVSGMFYSVVANRRPANLYLGQRGNSWLGGIGGRVVEDGGEIAVLLVVLAVGVGSTGGRGGSGRAMVAVEAGGGGGEKLLALVVLIVVVVVAAVKMVLFLSY